MMRSFEALLAAIIVISFMIYLVSHPSIISTSLNYKEKNVDVVRYCHLSSKGYNLKVMIVKFNQSFDHACVVINYPANYTLAYSKDFIPSMGGKNITLQIESYNGEPIFIYITNETQGNKFNCQYPLKNYNYTYVIQPMDYKLLCEGAE